MRDAWQEYNFESEDSSGPNNKEQLTALLLSVFVGALGAGRFYVGDYLMGSLKLVLSIALCTATCYATTLTKAKMSREIDRNSKTKWRYFFAFCAYCLMWIAWLAWLVADVVLFALNVVHDEDGKELNPM